MEIVQPYMDKTLSEGCLFTVFYDIGIKKIDHIIWDYINDLYLMPEHKTEWHKKDDDVVKEVLGHYDITALERCIKSKLKYMTRIDVCWWDRHFTVVWGWGKSLFSIPDKPPHLYTEGQNKTLLEWLKKLWKNV